MSPNDSEIQATPLWCSTRLGLAILFFFGYVSLYTVRVNMSVAIVCMTRQPGIADPCHNDTSVRDNVESCQQNTTDDDKFDWDKRTQGLILGAFFWGYMSTQVAGGWLADKCGGKHLLGWSTFGCGVATLLIPIAANYNVSVLIALRVLIGIFQGVFFPATAAMWANWAPPLERCKLNGIGYAGCPIGNVVSFSLSGLLCSHGFAGGWPSVFYVFGTLCVIWFVVWLLLVHDSPMQHPRISVEERAYIVKSLNSDIDVSKKSRTTPWKRIFTSLPVWSICVANLCTDWGLWTFLTNIASFMSDVLDIQVEQAKTVHRFSGIGDGRHDVGNIGNFILNSPKHQDVLKEVIETEVLIIDECSMISKKVIEQVQEVLALKNKNLLFGGTQIILCGDSFFKRVFPHTIHLKSVFRQSDPILVRAIREVSEGQVTKETVQLVNSTKSNSRPDGATINLFSKNDLVDDFNRDEILLHPGHLFEFNSTDGGEKTN